jgi:hypothetical protein
MQSTRATTDLDAVSVRLSSKRREGSSFSDGALPQVNRQAGAISKLIVWSSSFNQFVDALASGDFRHLDCLKQNGQGRLVTDHDSDARTTHAQP